MNRLAKSLISSALTVAAFYYGIESFKQDIKQDIEKDLLKNKSDLVGNQTMDNSSNKTVEQTVTLINEGDTAVYVRDPVTFGNDKTYRIYDYKNNVVKEYSGFYGRGIKAYDDTAKNIVVGRVTEIDSGKVGSENKNSKLSIYNEVDLAQRARGQFNLVP